MGKQDIGPEITPLSDHDHHGFRIFFQRFFSGWVLLWWIDVYWCSLPRAHAVARHSLILSIYRSVHRSAYFRRGFMRILLLGMTRYFFFWIKVKFQVPSPRFGEQRSKPCLGGNSLQVVFIVTSLTWQLFVAFHIQTHRIHVWYIC
jgi:hypothetical protein